MPHKQPARLERSCTASPRDWIRSAEPQAGFERIEAFFAGHGYDPHRHDTYAIGVTLQGVQSFGYGGTTLHSQSGQAIVLHPDEVHDGRAGTESGFRYRMAYIEPRFIRDALGERRLPLPFVREAVTGDRRLIDAIALALADLDTPLEDLQLDQTILAIAEALAALDRSSGHDRIRAPDMQGVIRARDFLDANLQRAVRSKELEDVSGLTRFALARHFRACLGTSPYRYVVMRRLDRARRLLQSGLPLADVAAESGFADQSHMTRQFKQAYGLSPGQWRKIASQRM
jgi:AraC-like DNA-binding protein